jgi:hypothetical protein
MKSLSELILTVILFSLLSNNVYSQCTLLGNMTAEVIESVSASSKTNSNFEIKTCVTCDNGKLVQSDLSSQMLDLGEINLYSGSDIACNVVLNQASLSDSAGNGFKIDPAVKGNSLGSTANAIGAHRIQLNARANSTPSQTSGLYQGSYAVVFAYN